MLGWGYRLLRGYLIVAGVLGFLPKREMVNINREVLPNSFFNMTLEKSTFEQKY